MNGVEVKKKRQELGLSQEDVAACIGVTQGYLSQVESGKKPMGVDQSVRLKSFFHTHSEPTYKVRKRK